MWRFIRKTLYISVFLGLVSLNFLTLANSAVHDMLYGWLSKLPISELLANSPSNTREQRIQKKVQDHKAKMKRKAKAVSARMQSRFKLGAKRNLTSVPAQVLPFLGIGSTVVFAGWDAKDFCNSMEDMHELMGVIDDSQEAYEAEGICYVVPSYKEKCVEEEAYAPDGSFGGFMHDLKIRFWPKQSCVNSG